MARHNHDTSLPMAKDVVSAAMTGEFPALAE